MDAPIEVSLDESEDTKDDEVTAVENPPPVIEEVVDDDDDDLEVIECEIIQPVFPIEDLTTSDCESVVDTTEEKADPTILEEEMAEEEKDKEVDTTMEIEQSNEQIPSVDKDEGMNHVLILECVFLYLQYFSHSTVCLNKILMNVLVSHNLISSFWCDEVFYDSQVYFKDIYFKFYYHRYYKNQKL